MYRSVELWEASADEPIWRGRADKILSHNPDPDLAKIDKGMAKMFRSSPPKT